MVFCHSLCWGPRDFHSLKFVSSANGLIPLLLLFTPKASQNKNAFDCSEWFISAFSLNISLSTKKKKKILEVQPNFQTTPKTYSYAPILHLLHHTEGALNKNKNGSAAKASLTNIHLTLDILLERMSCESHPCSWGQHCTEMKGFSLGSDLLALHLADSAVLRSASGSDSRGQTHWLAGSVPASFPQQRSFVQGAKS